MDPPAAESTQPAPIAEVNMSDNVACKVAELRANASGQEETSSIFIKSSSHNDQENLDTHSCKQICLPLPCLPHENNIVYCFILSVWDNVIGPQTVQVWTRESKPPRTSQLQHTDNQATRQSASMDELPSKKDNNIGMNRDESCSQSSEQSQNLPAQQRDFNASCSAPHSAEVTTTNQFHLSTSKPQKKGSSRLQSIVRYVTEHTVTLAQVNQPSSGRDVSSEEPSSTIMIIPQHGIIIQALRFLVQEEADVLVPHCLSMVVSIKEEKQLLQVSSLTCSYLLRILRKLRIYLSGSTLHKIGEAVKQHLQELCWVLVSLRLHSLSLYPLYPSGQPPSDHQFALKLLTSHLTTAGYTVVVGNTCTAVNSVLLWLGQFLRPQELHLSRLCWDPCYNEVQPGLFLQGVVSSSSKEGVNAERLLQFGRPVTLCDLNNLIVSHTIVRRTSSNKEVLKEVSEISNLVRQFSHDCQLLMSHSCEVRSGFTQAFMRSLHYQALALITFVKHNKSESSQKLLSKLRSVLDLDEPSLSLVLALGEKLQPGLGNLIAGQA